MISTSNLTTERGVKNSPPDFPALAATPAFLDKNGLSVASWADETHVYLVASKAGRAALQQLL